MTKRISAAARAHYTKQRRCCCNGLLQQRNTSNTSWCWLYTNNMLTRIPKPFTVRLFWHAHRSVSPQMTFSMTTAKNCTYGDNLSVKQWHFTSIKQSCSMMQSTYSAEWQKVKCSRSQFLQWQLTVFRALHLNHPNQPAAFKQRAGWARTTAWFSIRQDLLVLSRCSTESCFLGWGLFAREKKQKDEKATPLINRIVFK